MTRQTLGIILLAGPIPLLFLALSLYAISSFVIASIFTASGEVSNTLVIFGKVIHILLQLLGIVAVLGIPVGMPIGIYLIFTPKKGA